MSRRRNDHLQETHTLVLAHPSTAATLTRLLWTAPYACVLDAIGYRNATGLVTHNDNHFTGELQKTGAVKVADLFNTDADSDPAGAAIPAGTLTAGTLATEAARTLAAGNVLSLVATKTGTQTLPEGTVEITVRRI